MTAVPYLLTSTEPPDPPGFAELVEAAQIPEYDGRLLAPAGGFATGHDGRCDITPTGRLTPEIHQSLTVRPVHSEAARLRRRQHRPLRHERFPAISEASHPLSRHPLSAFVGSPCVASPISEMSHLITWPDHAGPPGFPYPFRTLTRGDDPATLMGILFVQLGVRGERSWLPTSSSAASRTSCPTAAVSRTSSPAETTRPAAGRRWKACRSRHHHDQFGSDRIVGRSERQSVSTDWRSAPERVPGGAARTCAHGPVSQAAL